MGSQVKAKCQCGLNTSILIGGGIQNFTTICFFPCLCERCQAVVQVNLLDKQKNCPQCESTKIIPYDNPELIDIAGEHIVASWNIAKKLGRVLKLTDGNYKCPQCGQLTLRFMDTGLCWD